MLVNSNHDDCPSRLGSFLDLLYFLYMGKNKQIGKDKKDLIIDESVFEKVLGKATKQLPFSPKKSGKVTRQTSSR